jgi:hypothetical protein
MYIAGKRKGTNIKQIIPIMNSHKQANVNKFIVDVNLEQELAKLEIPPDYDWLAEKVKVDNLLYNMRKYNAFTVEELQQKMKQQRIKK